MAEWTGKTHKPENIFGLESLSIVENWKVSRTGAVLTYRCKHRWKWSNREWMVVVDLPLSGPLRLIVQYELGQFLSLPPVLRRGASL